MFYILISFVLVLCLLDYIFNKNEKALLIKKIPGFESCFLIGNATVALVSPVELFRLGRTTAAKYKDIYSFHSFNVSAVNIYSPEDIETVISTMKYHEKSGVYNLLKPWLRDGLLLSSGSKWHQRRKILTSAFHFNVLRQYFTIFEENNQHLLRTLEKSSGNPTDITTLMSEYTLSAICESAMGTQINKETSKMGVAYRNALLHIVELIVTRFSKVYLFQDIIFNLTNLGKLQTKYLSIIHKFTENVIKNRKEALKNNQVVPIEIDKEADDIYCTKYKKRSAMLDLLIAAEKEGSVDAIGIQEEVDTFTFEGHDTTSAGLIFFLLSVANDAEIQDKIVAELREIFGDTERVATMEDLNKMHYLERCIKESLRLYPPVPFISRALNETVILSDYTIPAGTFCNIHIFDLHRRADIYENPLEFNPDRFLPENCENRHNFAYIPFSAGPRNCIGQKFAMLEMKSLLTAILRNFTLEPVTKPSDLVFTADLILRNCKPVFVNFNERKHKI